MSIPPHRVTAGDDYLVRPYSQGPLSQTTLPSTSPQPPYWHIRDRFSRDVAFKRVKVARAAAGHPEIFEHLESRELSLSSIVAMASHLGTLDGAEERELVDAARRKSKREVERMIDACLPDKASPCQPRGGELCLQMSERFEELLREARDLEAVHDAAAILEKSLETFVALRRKQRFAQTDRPPHKAREVTSNAIPSRVKREVYRRDGGVCSFVGESHLGTRRCESTNQLEISRALGGDSTTDNIRLLCRNHNQHEAERILGKQHVEEAKGRARSSRDALAAQKRAANTPLETANLPAGFIIPLNMSYTTKSDIALDAIEEVYEWYPWGSRKTSRFLIGGQIVGTRCFFESGGVELETPQQDGQRHGTPYEWNEEGDEQQRAIRAIDHAPRLESKA